MGRQAHHGVIMADHITDALELRLADLERKRKARTNKAGYEENVAELDEAIGQLKAEIATRKAAS